MSAADLTGAMTANDAFRLFRVCFDLAALIANQGSDAPPWAAEAIIAKHGAADLLPVLRARLQEALAAERDNATEQAIAAALAQGLPVFEPGGFVALAQADLAIRAAKDGAA